MVLSGDDTSTLCGIHSVGRGVRVYDFDVVIRCGCSLGVTATFVIPSSVL